MGKLVYRKRHTIQKTKIIFENDINIQILNFKDYFWYHLCGVFLKFCELV